MDINFIIQSTIKKIKMCSIDLYNYNDSTYEVEIELYKQVVEVIKQTEGKWYNPKTRKYNIPKSSYHQFYMAVKDIAEVRLMGDRPPSPPKVVNKPTPKIHMLNADRFSVSMPYNKDAIEFFKTIKGRFCGNTKEWDFDLVHYSAVDEFLKNLQV